MTDPSGTGSPIAPKHIPICAIGASAGGVSALRHLFRELPEDLGLAYVVIVHLSPEHPSALAEILSSCTRMGVHQVTDTPKLTANCVYVIPPDRELVIKGDSVTAREFSEPRGHRSPVDMFFRSVANARGDGMAIVLTGSGADGSNGVKAVHEAGGVIFAQDPAEAEFPAMPQNTIATGVVNFVAPINRLVERIVEVSRSKEAVRSFDEDGAADTLRRIVGFLRSRTGHDFSSYKRATVMRRVLRRLQVCRKTSLDDYLEHLMTTPEEAQELFNDLLISVTQFFRDEAAYEALVKGVIGPLFEDVDDEGIRIWSAGCATGEEAYSLAILILEEAKRREVSVPVQIFASDLDEGALQTAREGRYLRSIEADVSEDRLQAYFIDEGTHYRVNAEVRDAVLFASHSVLKDPPFMRLDLITCRNLLIYLERSLQEQLLSIFHYGLRIGGHLFLGSAETADSNPELFTALNRDARIYTAQSGPVRQLPAMPHTPVESYTPTVDRRATRPADRYTSPGDLHATTLEEMAPPSALVDHTLQIVHLSPNAGRFIRHSGGTFSSKLPNVVHPELRFDLKIALELAFDRKEPSLSFPRPVSFEEGVRRIAIQVTPTPARGNTAARALVVFLDGGSVREESVTLPSESDLAPEDVRRLHAELKAAQEALIASRGEHETAIEDLRTANEELQSINEEYRSTSEELETSKEELQSMNEELQTVNAELKAKLRSISSAHSDLQNLTSATEIGTLFLDAKLRIRMFTPPMAELFNITDMDVGRAITDFTHRLRYDSVETDARRVLRDLSPSESEVQGQDGRWFMMRIRPYRTVDDRIDGVVLTFVDVTSRRQTERELLDSRQQYETLFNSIDEGFTIMEIMRDEDGSPQDYRFVDVNAAFERQTGLSDAIGHTARELIPGHEEYWFETYGRIARTGEPERFEHAAGALDRYYEVFSFRIDTPDKQRVGALFRDIRDRKEAEAQRELLTHELSHRVKNSLAVVQALALQATSPSMTVDDYRRGLVGRIRALALAHDQLLETNWQSADLATLVDTTLSAYRSAAGPAIRIDGASINLTPKQGLGLALILHELATNASKYGSLSEKGGNLDVTWRRIEGPKGSEIGLTWTERGGPRIETPRGQGFGTRLIERATSYELEGTAELQFAPEGLTVEIVFPEER